MSPARNYRLLIPLVLAIIGAIFYPNMYRIFSIFDWIPIDDAGFLLQPTAEQIVRLQAQSAEQSIMFKEPGTYRIFSPGRTLSARNLVIMSAVDGQIIELIPLPSYLDEYDTELIKGVALFDIHIDQAGEYKIYTVNASRNTHSLLIARDYSAQNKVRTTLALVIPVVGFLLYWYITGRPVASKSIRQEKRSKFDELL